MAMPKKYPERLMVRLSKGGKKGLAKKAKIMGVKPAVAGRIIIEHGVLDDNYKEPKK